MSGCIECWDTPCECGHEYKHLAKKELKDLIKTLNGILKKKSKVKKKKETK